MNSLKFRNLNRNEKILGCLTAVALFLVFERAVSSPWQRQSAQLNQEIEGLKAKIAADQRTYDQLKLAERAPAAIEPASSPEIAKGLEHMGDSTGTFLSNILQFEHKSSFHILKIATDASGVVDNFVRTPVVLDVETSFPEIGNFLEKLEDAHLVAEVENMEIYRAENDLKRCSARMRILTYEVRQ